jgi:hypothetical protein
MYGILVSALATVSNFVFGSLLLKGVLFTLMFYIASEFITFITGCGCLPNAPAISASFNAVPPSVWYFLNIFGLAQGVTAIFCAFVVRFLIRRIPFFG